MQRGFAPFVWIFVAIMILGVFAGLGLGGFGGGLTTKEKLLAIEKAPLAKAAS